MISLYNVLDWNELLYTDTDSIKFDIKYYNKMISNLNNWNIPHWTEVEKYDSWYNILNIYEQNKKIFGSVDDELIKYQDKMHGFIVIQKKLWLVYDKFGGIIKCGTKSIKPNDIMLTWFDLNWFKVLKNIKNIDLSKVS